MKFRQNERFETPPNPSRLNNDKIPLMNIQDAPRITLERRLAGADRDNPVIYPD